MSESSYIALYKSGILEERARALEARLASCDICPRECRVDRLAGERGPCRSGKLPIVASYCAHHGEEPAISGSVGSGTIFFGNCNMRCVYCQNHQISQGYLSQPADEIGPETLAGHMLELQEMGCHNINLVSPSHFVPQIVRGLAAAAAKGLRLPLLYNTSGYDSLDTIKALDGIVDIYLPDLRYASDKHAKRFSGVSNYVASARAAIKEMYRQVGALEVDDGGVARRGLVVRFLILPNRLAGCAESLSWLAEEVSPLVAVSIMAQYFPAHRARQFPELARRINSAEYAEVAGLVERLGLENGWVQEMESADNYLPDFHREGHPFEPASG